MDYFRKYTVVHNMVMIIHLIMTYKLDLPIQGKYYDSTTELLILLLLLLLAT